MFFRQGVELLLHLLGSNEVILMVARDLLSLHFKVRVAFDAGIDEFALQFGFFYLIDERID